MTQVRSNSPVSVDQPPSPAAYVIAHPCLHEGPLHTPLTPASSVPATAGPAPATDALSPGPPPPSPPDSAEAPGDPPPPASPLPSAAPPVAAAPPPPGPKSVDLFDGAIDFGEDYEGDAPELQTKGPPRSTLLAAAPVASAPMTGASPGTPAPAPPAPSAATSTGVPAAKDDSEEVEMMEAPEVEVEMMEAPEVEVEMMEAPAEEVEMMEVPSLDELATSEAEDPDSVVGVARRLRALLDDKWRWVDVGDEAEMRFEWTPEERQELYTLLRRLCLCCIEIFKAEDYPMLRLESPLFVMGDIHGRFDDLHFFLSQFYAKGPPPSPPPASHPETVRVADNLLVMADDGEYEVQRLSQLPSVLSGSSADLLAARRQASMFVAGKESMRGQRLLFLGDFVDRGFASLEVIAYVLCLKALNPANVHVLRGNHELRIINQNYGFLGQCMDLFGRAVGCDLWELVNRVFDVLPIAATIDDRIFCVHGGIPRLGPDGWEDRMSILKRTGWWLDIRDSMDQWDLLQEEKYARFKEVFDDLLWADPAPDGVALDELGFGPSERGISVSYGNSAVDTFLDATDFRLLLRAHQMKARGFNVCKGGRVVTIFTSSHYEQNDNVAGAAFVANGTVRAVTRKDF